MKTSLYPYREWKELRFLKIEIEKQKFLLKNKNMFKKWVRAQQEKGWTSVIST
jgi:hypothetical protein